MTETNFIPTHGNYKKLLSYKKSLIIYSGTVLFCNRFLNKRDRTVDQMVQAARSGKQNIVEGSMASGTSKETEIKLVNVARASLEELLEDYMDFIRNKQGIIWEKDSKEALYVRKLAYLRDESFETYREFLETRDGIVCANIMACLVNQCNFLLDRQIKRLEQDFVRQGGLRERMSQVRRNFRRN
jgi:four helix bundle suffix protein